MKYVPLALHQFLRTAVHFKHSSGISYFKAFRKLLGLCADTSGRIRQKDTTVLVIVRLMYAKTMQIYRLLRERFAYLMTDACCKTLLCII